MSLEKGCRVAVETCMGIQSHEKVVVVSDDESLEIGKKLREVALETTNRVRFFNLGIYGDRPLSELPEAVEEAASDADVTFWTARSYEGELETIRQPFMKKALQGGRHGHMVNITEEIMETAMAVDYEKIDEFTEKMHDKLKDASEVRVTTERGTDFVARFKGMTKWVPSTGICHENGHWINLPDGEIFTAPSFMEGKVVVDGTLGEYLGEKYEHDDLQETPITLQIEEEDGKGKCVDISCENEDIEKDLEEYLSRNECSSFVGEVGFGTNIFLEELSNNMLQDEKFPGVHIAFGDPIAEETYAGWTCPEHLDMILTGCTVRIAGEKVMEDGEYLI